MVRQRGWGGRPCGRRQVIQSGGAFERSAPDFQTEEKYHGTPRTCRHIASSQSERSDDKAEDPEKLLKQLVLDMENQLMQVNTAGRHCPGRRHLLEKKSAGARRRRGGMEAQRRSCGTQVRRWTGAGALEPLLSAKTMSAGFAQQLEDQKTRVETAEKRAAQSGSEARGNAQRCELMIAEHRRARVVGRAQHAREVIAKKEGDSASHG